jgi:hypothetical protein
MSPPAIAFLGDRESPLAKRWYASSLTWALDPACPAPPRQQILDYQIFNKLTNQQINQLTD